MKGRRKDAKQCMGYPYSSPFNEKEMILNLLQARQKREGKKKNDIGVKTQVQIVK